MHRLAAAVGISSAPLLTGCFDVKEVDPGPEAVAIVVDPDGRVDPGKNHFGLSGFWYAYGDQYTTPARCTEWGAHAPEQCAQIDAPPPLPSLAFVNSGGRMCTSGQAEQVLECDKAKAKLPCPDLENTDFANMWGAGIGLDFALKFDDEMPLVRSADPDHREPWNASEHGVVGVAFDVEMPDVGDLGWVNLRVEFPMRLPDGTLLPDGTSTVLFDDTPIYATDPRDSLPANTSSEEYPGGSPFWGAPPKWGGPHNDSSPVVVGHNQFLWSAVKRPPDAKFEFSPAAILGIQFHVAPVIHDPRTNAAVALPYAFCISNLALLRE